MMSFNAVLCHGGVILTETSWPWQRRASSSSAD